ncbi:hypothetical protein GQ44DRAFT_780287 [Phaeosphaeriaceae sp. PMI808]|nr:hypothetical protein GQ44DRAFT_780287 [Phaeosphaeriaceae sp. PMI808]
MGGNRALANEQKRQREPFSTFPFMRDPDFVDRPHVLAWIREKCTAPAVVPPLWASAA